MGKAIKNINFKQLFTAENLVYLYVILLPILDSFSFIFRTYIHQGTLSPTTFLRPIIPLIILCIVYFKSCMSEKIQVLILGIINIIYIAIHMAIFAAMKSGFTGSYYEEMQYLINFSFTLINIYILAKVFFRRYTRKLKFTICIMSAIYMLFIFVPIILNISPTTYMEGQGLKGFYQTGNSIAAILLIASAIIMTGFNSSKKKIYVGVFLLVELYLIVFLGTRAGFYGAILNIIVYFIALGIEKLVRHFMYIQTNEYIHNKKKKQKAFKNNLTPHDYILKQKYNVKEQEAKENIFQTFIKNVEKLIKQNVLITLMIALFIILLVTLLIVNHGPEFTKRRQFIQNENNKFEITTQNATQENQQVAQEYDIDQLNKMALDPTAISKNKVPDQLAQIVYLIENDPNNPYLQKMPDWQKQSYLAIEHKIASNNFAKTDLRKIQTEYANIEMQKQSEDKKGWLYTLFGNTYKGKMPELQLEREFKSFFVNFGVIGALLYIIPVIALFAYFIIFGIRNIKKIDRNYYIYTYILLLSFGLSYFMGATYFSIAANFLIACAIIMQLNKIDGIKRSRNYNKNMVVENITLSQENNLANLEKEKEKIIRKKENILRKSSISKLRKRKKVVFGITSLTIGGAERVLVDIVKELQDVYNITIFTLYKHGEFEKELLGTNVKVRTLFNFQRETAPIFVQKLSSAILKMFQGIIYNMYIKNIYDVEIAFLEGPITRLFAYPSYARKIAWVHTDMELYYNTVNNPEQKKKEDKKAYSMYEEIVFVSKAAKEKFEKLFPDNTVPKTVIYNYIDFKRINYLKNTQAASYMNTDVTTLLSVCRLTYAKGLERFIKVHKRLIDNGYIHKVYIVGDGPDYDKLQKLINKLNVKKSFILLGKKQNPYPYIDHCDYLCLFSISEGYGIVLDEGKLLGKPILITDTAAREALVGYDNGQIFENTQEGMYKGLEKVLSNRKHMYKKNKNNNKKTLYNELNTNKIYQIIDLIGK